MPQPAPCPSEAALSDFVAGRVPAADLDALCAHVDGCRACQGRLAALDGRTDTLARALRQLPSVDQESTALRSNTQPAGVAARAGPSLQDETRDLLRRRLLVTGVVGAVAAAALGSARLAGAADAITASSGTGLAVLVAYGAAAAASVWRILARPGATLRELRGHELVHVAGLVAFSAHFRWTALATGATRAFASDDHRVLYVEQATLLSNLTCYLSVIGYGLLIPNTLRRSARVVAGMSLATLASVVATGLAFDYARDRLPPLAVATAVGLFVSGALAVFGSYKIRALQAEAAAARELGPYRLVRKLGAGGMGEVWLAEHGLLKRPCAVKMIRPGAAGDPEVLRRFEREVRATARLSHPNTIEVFDYGRTADGTFYYVMEYLAGPNLSELIRRHGPVAPARGAYLLAQLCGALREAHGAGLVHRDIKPGNVIVCERGGAVDTVKLLDFGLVRTPDEGGDRALTRTGIVMGTPEYMAPEQAAGAPVDARADVYGLGALAFYLFAARAPFVAGTALDVLVASRRDPVPRLRELVPGFPADLEVVVLRCLEKAPGDRYASVGELEAALATCACAGQWTGELAAAWWREHESAAGEPPTPALDR